MEEFWSWFSYLGFDPAPYSIAIEIYLRLLGILYMIVYVPFLFQMRGLYGIRGIRSIARYLELIKQRLGWKAYYYVPTVWWFRATDKMLLGTIWVGVLCGFLLALGIATPIMLLILLIIHISLTSAGQDFMSFGWETLLIEFTAATLLMTATTPYNALGWITLNFIFLRFMIQAGASKLRTGDPTWRDLSAISYHYLTQPIPNAQAWYAHKMPMWVHKAAVIGTFWIELVIPVLTFSPPEVRFFCFVNYFALLLVIWQTGNFSYLNLMTIIVAVIFVENSFLEPLLTIPVSTVESSWGWYYLVSLLAGGILFLQIINLWTYFFPSKWMQKTLVFFQPFHIANTHQLFSMMTTKRYEVVIEGSHDGKCWKEYLFYYKISELSKRPVRISPYQPRIDWQAWFLPFREFKYQYWFHSFIQKLLEGEPVVTKLLRYNPFEEKPPKHIRVLMYDYEFTTWDERKKTGHWWKRRLIGEYAPPMSLNPNEIKNS